MSDLSPEARALLEQAAHADDPSPEDEARVARALAVTLGVAALVPAATASSRLALWWARASLSVKVTALSVTVVGGGGAAVWSVTRAPPARPAITASTPSRPRAAVSAPTRAPRAPELAPPPTLPPAPAPAPPPTTVSAPSRSGRAHDARPQEDTLAEESALLGAAHRALVAGDPSRALSTLDVYDARFPHGALHEERDAERVLVLCGLERREESRQAAERFLRAHPRSPLAPHVRRACALSNSSEGR